MKKPNSKSRTPFRQQIRPLLPYVQRYRTGIWGGLVFLLLENALRAIFPIVVARGVDSLNESATTTGTILYYGGALLVLAAVMGLLLYLKRWILITISREIEYDIRQDLYEHLQKQPVQFFASWRIGDLMSRSTNDLNAVRMMTGPAFMYITNAVAAFAFAIVAMAYLDVTLTMMLLLPVPVVATIVSFFGREIHDRFEKIQSKLADLTAQVQENVAGARLVRAYTQETAEEKKFWNTNQEFIQRNRKLIRIQSMFWPSLEGLVMVAFLLVLCLGGRAVLTGRISVGEFVAFMQFMFILTWPMIALGWVVNIIQRGLASLSRLNKLMSAEPAVVDLSKAGAPAEIRGEIEFRNLTFRYNGTPILRDINLRIPAGKTVAVVGPTGSGKTTLINLIGRLYDAPPGTLFIDGRPVTEFPLAALRRAIGYVPQETFLFSDTLGANIALGSPDASGDDIRTATRISGLTADVEGFIRGFETRIGERGVTLSGGQKQRTAIARAVIRNPQILILDDALSSVDTVTEARILDRLQKVMRDRTSIIISHRVSTVQHADQIVVLKEGRIVEQGSHGQLLERRGYYHDLYQRQLLREELERQ